MEEFWMNMLFAFLMLFTSWYYVPVESPSLPAEVKSIDLKLKRNELAITFFSLQEGESALIQHPDGENILINTGGEGSGEELSRLLGLYNVEQISTIIMTEEDANSMENAGSIIREFGVKQLVAGQGLARKRMEELEEFDEVNIHIWGAGTKQQLFHNLKAEVLFENENPKEGMDLELTLMKHKVLLLNSSSLDAEKALLKKNLSDVNIVKMPGFGQGNSVSGQLIKHLDPQIAVIFQSRKVKPDEDLFKMLHEAWIDVYYTGVHGTVTIKFTDLNYEVITISPGEAG
ncbi:ATP-dependent DNA helicase [Bacillus infantis]|uniref:ATP-dependent DNA helicase n=2 Tax=Bacillus infantis TaxID=324767 RepID=A0A5D4RHX1_9BACI|nr:ATP-dependent DNA helicase [Bacillus infantis]